MAMRISRRHPATQRATMGSWRRIYRKQPYSLTLILLSYKAVTYGLFFHFCGRMFSEKAWHARTRYLVGVGVGCVKSRKQEAGTQAQKPLLRAQCLLHAARWSCWSAVACSLLTSAPTGRTPSTYTQCATWVAAVCAQRVNKSRKSKAVKRSEKKTLNATSPTRSLGMRSNFRR